ncbi:hypothetical protein [Streptococcus sp. DD13]|uniref:hypothetical protein n=1 Tax=Streptococcus sp. DD13 TaxID=1777881 RepID=UPI001E3BBE3D|nr:hypothetical protein [Streptococcus sp. DD13]
MVAPLASVITGSVVIPAAVLVLVEIASNCAAIAEVPSAAVAFPVKPAAVKLAIKLSTAVPSFSRWAS